MKTVIITGINSGLGKAFFDYFISAPDYFVIGISRRITESQKRLLKAKRFCHISLDLMLLDNVEKQLNLKKHIKEKSEAVIFINNAATIQPIDAIGQFDDKAIIKTIKVNSIAPLLITNYILSLSLRSLKFINISSGAAERPIVGWSLYCATKSANSLFFETLKRQEANNKDVEVYNIDPGVLDTNMQGLIRSTNKEVFPELNGFIDLKEENQLKSPKDAAKEILSKCNIS